MTAISRNSPCPCGSGKRYKHCCGAEIPAVSTAAGLRETMLSALASQRAGDLVSAEESYRRALSLKPDEPDCLHMLGVICLESGRYREAFDSVFQALALTDWRIESMRHNMGLILVRLLAGADSGITSSLRHRYAEFYRMRAARRDPSEPLVSIVIPSYNHARWIRQALESVYRQTYPRLELIVIDDGSSDDSPQVIRESLANCPFPHRFIARENRGAHATLNEAAALAGGEYINALNSDDRFSDDRIALMVEHVARTGADWGFGNVTFIDAEGSAIDPAQNRRVFSLLMQLAKASKTETLAAALLRSNLAVSTGNLFVRKALFDALGGFRDQRYNHDWDFCLRASLESEPVFVPTPVYAYRLHESNTIGESIDATRRDADRIFIDFLKRATDGPAPANEYAPTAHAWSIRFYLWIAENGQASLLPRQALQRLAQLALAAPSTAHGAKFEEVEPFAPINDAAGLIDQLIDALPQRPLISILLPTYNTPPRWLRKCIDSVRDQFYPNWELCISDDASPNPEVREMIQRYAQSEYRIKFLLREHNGHISQATNSALSLAGGEFFALLDHDDELTPDALYWVAREITRYPDAGMIYSDEDKIDELGARSHPYLKPDWNPALLLGQNCISHLGVYRTELVRSVGGFRSGLEGAQDWDLALRVSERITPRQIRHIPQILYHWRTIEGSTARATGQKKFVVEAQRRALQEHFQRTEINAAQTQIGDHWLTAYALPAPAPVTSLVIDARGALLATWGECLPRLLAATDYPNLEIVLCHDAALPPAMSVLPLSLLTCPPGENAGEVYRRAAQACKGELIGVFSSPCIAHDPQWLKVLAAYALQKDHGAIAPKIITADGRFAFAGTLLGLASGIAFPYVGKRHDMIGQAGRARLPQNFQALGAAFILLQKEKLSEAGGFQACYSSAIAVSVGLCLSLRAAGYWNVWAPAGVLISASAPNYALAERDLTRLKHEWPQAFLHDPAYHPDLPRERPFETA